MRDDRLEPAMTPRGKRRTRLADTEACQHESVRQAFAHRRSRDEHWPIVYCADCYAILGGLVRLFADSFRAGSSTSRTSSSRAGRGTGRRPAGRGPTAPPGEIAWPDVA